MLKYKSTQVLSLRLSIKLKESIYIWYCTEYGYFIGKSYKNVGVLAQGACTLSVHRSIQPEHKMSKKSLVQYSNLLNCYVDTIFVLPNLGIGQGISTKTGD